MTPPRPDVHPAPSRARLWIFRILAATLASATLLGGLELVLRLAGVGWPTGFLLPGQAQGQAVWNENPRFTWRFMPPELGRTPQPLAIPTRRDPGSLRVLVLGESAAMGDPEPAYGFPRALECLLESRFPGRKVEVVNAAMTAINSHVIRDIARDCTALDADVWVVYMGNNEVTGPFGPGTVFGRQSPPAGLVRAGLWLQRTRTGQWFGQLARGLGRSSSSSPASWGGLEMFLDRQLALDDPRLDGVRSAFEQNLRDIIETGRASGARVVVSTVAVNIRDSAPFGSMNDPKLPASDRTAWQAAFADGLRAEADRDGRAARAAYDKALRLDASHAELMFRRSRLALGANDTNGVAGYLHARDLDTLRFRTDSGLNDIIRKVAANREKDGVWLVDAEKTFASNGAAGLPGDEFFWEHVHFRLPGSYLLAVLAGSGIIEALPPDQKQGAQPDWISLDAVARQLAVTLWGDFRIAEGVRSRFRRPPFSTQAYAEEREQRIQKELASLSRGMAPTAFGAQAEVFRKRIAERPGDWVLRDQFGRMHESFGDVAGASNEWVAVIGLVPHHFGVRLQLGRMLATRDESAAEGERWLREAIALRPRTAEVHAALGQALARQKKFSQANSEFETASRLRPDLLEAEVQWGISLAAEGRTDDARRHLSRALQISTNSALAHLHLARLAAKAGDTNSARASYSEVLRLAPNYREAREFLGIPTGDPGAVTP